nr:adenosylhomocysteinase [bacterium]
MSDIASPALAGQGKLKLSWASGYMPLLNAIEKQYAPSKPLKGLRVAVSVHLEAKTAILVKTLAAMGAAVRATGCNPLSTQDDVAAALNEVPGVEVFARHGVDSQTYTRHLKMALGDGVDVFIDDGGDFVQLLHSELRALLPGIRGGCEETTTGVMRLKAREKAGELKIPMIAVNNARCKYLFDNRYGTGQSVWDGIVRTTNVAVAGRCVVVAGYGWCGKGVAMRARGLGARVIVCEVDATKAIEAVMDGFEAMPMMQAAPLGDIFVTVTGCKGVIRAEHMQAMHDGAILCNAGHFDVEIDKTDLETLCVEHHAARKNIESYIMPDGRALHLLGEGRLVNLACGDGHPIEVMDVSFALQALSVLHVASGALQAPGVYAVPEELDNRVAHMRLASMGGGVDTLTQEQRDYLEGWNG